MTRRIDEWRQGIDRAALACRRVGGDVQRIDFAPPASDAEVQQVEQRLGRPLPHSLRAFFIGHAATVDVAWFLPSGTEVPFLPDIFCGSARIALQDMPELTQAYATWVQECFANPDDPYDAVWHGKFPLLAVGNGDFLAIDLLSDNDNVVYISHDDGEGHGITLAGGVLDLLDRWTKLGCVGAEDWQWLPFHEHGGLDPAGERSRALYEWFDGSTDE